MKKKNTHIFFLFLLTIVMIFFPAFTEANSPDEGDNNQEYWKKWQTQFKNELEQLKKFDENSKIPNSEKAAKWQQLLKKFNRNNPFSRQDELFKKYISKRIQAKKSNIQPAKTDFQGSFFIKIKTRIEQQNQPSKDIDTVHWINNHNYAIVSKANSIIFNLKENVGFFLIHKSKRFVIMKLPLEQSKIFAKSTLDTLSGMKTSIHVTPTPEKKKIKNYICHGYDMEIKILSMSLKSRIWATENVPFNWKLYQDIYLKFTMISFLLDDASIRELKKIKGFWISTEMKMDLLGNDFISTSDVIKISKAPIHQGIFTIPQGYTKQDFLLQTDLQQK